MADIELTPPIRAGAEKTLQRKLVNVEVEDKLDCEELGHIVPISVLTCYMVEAVLELLRNRMPRGYISVGSVLNSCHMKPTVAGMVITIHVKLTAVEGNQLFFEIDIYDEIGMIARANHIRHVVSQYGFMEEVKKRIEQVKSAG